MADNDTVSNHLSPAIRDLLSALRDLLDVPIAGHNDRKAEHRLTRDRLTTAHAVIDIALDNDMPASLQALTATVRKRLAEMPTPYEPATFTPKTSAHASTDAGPEQAG
jgi:hypothetical protein